MTFPASSTKRAVATTACKQVGQPLLTGSNNSEKKPMGYGGGGGIGSGAGAGGIEGAPRDSHFFPRARFP